MKIKYRLFSLATLVSLVACVASEVAAFLIMPAAARLLSGLLFPVGTFIFFPAYRKLDRRLSLDIKKLADEKKYATSSAKPCGFPCGRQYTSLCRRSYFLCPILL